MNSMLVITSAGPCRSLEELRTAIARLIEKEMQTGRVSDLQVSYSMTAVPTRWIGRRASAASAAVGGELTGFEELHGALLHFSHAPYKPGDGPLSMRPAG